MRSLDTFYMDFSMKINKTVLSAVIALSISSLAHAAEQGNGKVTFSGSIVDAPCSIAPESVDQTVEMGQISNKALLNSGKTTPRNFYVQLEECSFDAKKTKNKVTATFSGMDSKYAAGLLGITGTASGASIALTDGSGKLIKLGESTSVQTLTTGKNTLSFAAYMQGNGASEAIVEGDFRSVANFTLAYN